MSLWGVEVKGGETALFTGKVTPTKVLTPICRKPQVTWHPREHPYKWYIHI